MYNDDDIFNEPLTGNRSSRGFDEFDEMFDFENSIRNRSSYDSYNERYDDDIFNERLSSYTESRDDLISERPSAKPYDFMELDVPGSSEIDVNVYNKALDDLKRSFKESVDIINMLRR